MKDLNNLLSQEQVIFEKNKTIKSFMAEIHFQKIWRGYYGRWS